MNKIVCETYDLTNITHETYDLTDTTIQLQHLRPGDFAVLSDRQFYKVIKSYWKSKKEYCVLFEVVHEQEN